MHGAMLGRIWVRRSTGRLPYLAKRQARKEVRIEQQRRETLIAATMQILNSAPHSKFQFEGACRHGLRSGFCAEGEGWSAADKAAAEIIGEALRLIGAKRPTWFEAQGDTAGEQNLVEHVQCGRCGKLLPENAPSWQRYCSRLCQLAANAEDRRRIMRLEGVAGYKATMAARAKERAAITLKACEHCNKSFRPQRSWSRFCSASCASHHQTFPPRDCLHCGRSFAPTKPGNRYCSAKCRVTASRARNAPKASTKAKINGFACEPVAAE